MPLQPAVLGTARLNNFRLNYLSPELAAIRKTKVRILLAGADVSVRISGLSIEDAINDTPNRCSLVIAAPPPTSGQTLRVTVNADAPRLLFNGTIQQDDLTYEGRPTQLVYPCRAIDDTAQLTRRRPFGTWVNISATTIAQAIIATYAPGFTSTHVEAALPAVSMIFDGTDDFAVALKRLASAIGGYWYVEDADVHLFTTEATNAPDPIQIGYPFCNDPAIAVTTDVSQLRTRQCGRGHGERVPVDVLVHETIIPIDDAVMFNASGGKAMAGTTPDGAQSQLLAYTGVRLGGGGSLVGTGASPGVAPAPAMVTGSGLGSGVYGVAYTFVTPAGESLPSPVGSVTTGVGEANPTTFPNTATYDNLGSILDDGFHDWAYTWLNATGGETLPSPRVTRLSANGTATAFTHPLPLGPAWVTARRLYRTSASGSSPTGLTLKLVATINDNTTTTYRDAIANGALGAAAPSSNTTAGNQILTSGIAIGPAATTSRKVYRTIANGTQLKLQQTIPNNTATVAVQDATPDGSLGATAPTVDTSALAFSGGQVNAGSSSILMTSAATYFSTGGWVILASGEVVRYTGTTGNTLTGIPATGPGAIHTTVPYGSVARPAPSLTGVTGLELAMLKGTPVSLWVQRDDLPAQATQAALDAANGRVPADGIYEGPPIVDERRGEDSLAALCEAYLALFSTPIVTVTYATRDTKTKSGKSIVVNLASPPIHQTLTIQGVHIDEIDIAPGLAPKFTTTASSWRTSLEDLLRRLSALMLES